MNDFSEVDALGHIAARHELLAANDTLSPACRERNRELAKQYRLAQESELIRLADIAATMEVA